MTDEAELHYAQFMKALAARIKEFRKERGLSLRDMVVKHDYHDSQWRKYEREGASSVGSLLRIARALNTTITVLLDGLGDHPSANVGTMQKSQEIREDVLPLPPEDGGTSVLQRETERRKSGGRRRGSG